MVDVFETGYRRLIYKNWLFLELNPGIGFSSEHDYAANPFIAAIFVITFQRVGPVIREDERRFGRR